MIVKRFLSIFFPPAEFTKIAITVDIGGQKFYANSKICTKQGYLEVIKDNNAKNKDNQQVSNTQDNESQENDSKIDVNTLAKIRKGQVLNLNEITTKEGETSPPSRYTSGSIILAMENAGKLIEDERLREQIKGSGIGTSATRAEIIKKLNRIGYIDINSKTQVLTPSQKGEQVYKAVSWSIPDMLNPDLTASWEKGLDMVAKKEIKPDEFMTKLELYIKSKTAKLKNG